MNKNKILLGVSNSFCAHFLKGQIRFLNNNGFEVIVISGPGEEIALIAKDEGAKLIAMPFSKTFSVWKDLFILFKIIRVLKKEKPSIINAGNPKSGFLIMVAAWLLKMPNRVFTLHGLVSDTKIGLKRFILTTIEKISARLSHHTLVVSKSLMAHAINRKIITPTKSRVLHNGSANGVDLALFSKKKYIETANDVASQLKLSKKFTIGYIGRVSNDKGIANLVQAFLKLQYTLPLQLVIVGPLEREDPLPENIVHEIYNNPDIYFVGKVLQSVAYYTLFNVLVLPSYREGFGNVLIEAAAMEVPVIASNIPGIRDAMSAENGIFVEPKKEQLEQAIKKTIVDTQWCEKAGKAGRNFVEQHFENKKLWHAYLLFYNDLLKKANFV